MSWKFDFSNRTPAYSTKGAKTVFFNKITLVDTNKNNAFYPDSMDLKVNVFILPQKSVSPQVIYTEADAEKDASYARILKIISRNTELAERKRGKKCDISIDVERHKIPALKKLLERKGYNVFVQGVYV